MLVIEASTSSCPSQSDTIAICLIASETLTLAARLRSAYHLQV